MITNPNEILYKDRTALDYCIDVLELNPIKESELKRFCPFLEKIGDEMIKNPNKRHPHGIHKDIWFKAWNIMLTERPQMVYITYPINDYWYVDINGNKTDGPELDHYHVMDTIT